MPLPDAAADDIELDESDNHDDQGKPAFTFAEKSFIDTQRPVRVVYADLSEHVGERVLVDLRRRVRDADRTECRLDLEDINNEVERMQYEQDLEYWGTELTGTLEVAHTTAEYNSGYRIDPELQEDHPDAEFALHTSGVFDKSDGPNGGTLIGEQGFSRVKGDDGMYHIVETADVFLQ